MGVALQFSSHAPDVVSSLNFGNGHWKASPVLFTTGKTFETLRVDTHYDVPVAAATLVDACMHYNSLDQGVKHTSQQASIHILNDLCPTTGAYQMHGFISKGQQVANFLQGLESLDGKHLPLVNLTRGTTGTFGLDSNGDLLLGAIRIISGHLNATRIAFPTIINSQLLLSSHEPFKLLADGAIPIAATGNHLDSIVGICYTFPQATGVLAYATSCQGVKFECNMEHMLPREKTLYFSALVASLQLIATVSYDKDHFSNITNAALNFTNYNWEYQGQNLQWQRYKFKNTTQQPLKDLSPFWKALTDDFNHSNAIKGDSEAFNRMFLEQLLEVASKAKVVGIIAARVPVICKIAQEFALAMLKFDNNYTRSKFATNQRLQASLVHLANFLYIDANNDGGITLYEYIDATLPNQGQNAQENAQEDPQNAIKGTEDATSIKREYTLEYATTVNSFLVTDANRNGHVDFVEYLSHQTTASIINLNVLQR